MTTGFKVITLKPQKVGRLGRVDAGVDVTSELATFRHLQSLVDMGEVMLVPTTGDFPKAEAKATSAAAPSPTPAEEAPTSVGEAEDVSPAEVDAITVTYMDDPTGFTVAEVIAYAEAHPEHAAMLLEMEAEGKNRNGVIKALTALLES